MPVSRLEEGRRHARQRALAGRDRIRLGADQLVDVRLAGLDRKVIHLVVEQDAGARHHEAGAEPGVER